MAELVGTGLPDLTPVPADGGGEGEPRHLYTLAGNEGTAFGVICSYDPSNGGAPRLAVRLYGGPGALVHVWDSGTGALLGTLEGPQPDRDYSNLVTYRRPSDGPPRIAGGDHEGRLLIWDGDDYSTVHAVSTNVDGHQVERLVVYEEPVTGRMRLVAA
jgi:WD40 repeat protein